MLPTQNVKTMKSVSSYVLWLIFAVWMLVLLAVIVLFDY